jgi:uncharacterized repeat protein (TIGR03803 family)
MQTRKLLPAVAAVALTLSPIMCAWATSKEKVLHAFDFGTDGAFASSALVADGSGNLYGTTPSGGLYGAGTVFELMPQSGGQWKEVLLYQFNGKKQGGTPEAALVFDSQGNLFGTTKYGGKGLRNGTGWGTVFELAKGSNGQWKQTTIHSFYAPTNDGTYPVAPLVVDGNGNLFGTTSGGGVDGCGNNAQGTAFELSPAGGGKWTEAEIHGFGCFDGTNPVAGLTLDAAGNLYTTTSKGGKTAVCNQGCGTVVELSFSAGQWNETVLYSFLGGVDGQNPLGSVVLDSSGNLYGTTQWGGGNGTCSQFGVNLFCGTAFELSPGSGGWTESIIHSFGGGNDGGNPAAGLIFDSAGNLYGTTEWGGGLGNCSPFGTNQFCGTVYQLSHGSSGWTENVIHSFADGTDGNNPTAALIVDTASVLYGTTAGVQDVGVATGTAFRLTPQGGTWAEAVLHTFSNANQGTFPGSIIFGPPGILYGTAGEGGNTHNCSYCGIVFELKRTSTGWKQRVLYDFRGSPDGAVPSSLISDASGNLYGVTSAGGNTTCFYSSSNCGTVFELKRTSRGWKEKILYRFAGGNDGWQPEGIVSDGAGNLYGTTSAGGASNAFCDPQVGCGTVFKLSPTAGGWKETVIYSFNGGTDGSRPGSVPVLDASGNLYGTTIEGGIICRTYAQQGCGTVYELSPSSNGWTEKLLYDFTGGKDGFSPVGNLLFDSTGNLFGTTYNDGGNCNAGHCGLVFELSPGSSGWTENTIYDFPGAAPTSDLVFGSGRTLYGATTTGDGTSCNPSCGFVYKLSQVSGGWKETTLHTFDGKDGANPFGAMILDGTGNLYGPAQGGIYHAGVVFEVIP